MKPAHEDRSPVDAINAYDRAVQARQRDIVAVLHREIAGVLERAEAKVWHGSPVWFLVGNPIVGYGVRKQDVQLLFWSGQSFDEPGLHPEGKFKAAALHITDAAQIDTRDLRRWLRKAKTIQWDYKNIVKRRGVLEKLGDW